MKFNLILLILVIVMPTVLIAHCKRPPAERVIVYSFFDLKKHLYYNNWNDEISFHVQRGEELVVVALVIVPVPVDK